MTSGLRERKKERTRERLSDVATRLFLERGYERTTIADVAEAAEVARMTVTNYFPLKEDLVFDRHEEIVSLWADAVTARQPGVSALAAVRAQHLQRIDDADPILGFVGVDFARMITDCPALLARERAILAAQEDRLAGVLATAFASSPADLAPRLAAVQLAGLARVLYYEGRRRLLAGESVLQIRRAVRRGARTGYDAIEPLLPQAYREA